MMRVGVLFLASLAVAPVAAAEILPPASQRFAAAKGDEVPSFQRHVVPLLGRLGCNGRACHGSFQGQGGFRLSLFGYDFKADHEALTGGDEPRVDRKDARRQPDPAEADARPSRTRAASGWTPAAGSTTCCCRWIEAGAPAVQGRRRRVRRARSRAERDRLSRRRARRCSSGSSPTGPTASRKTSRRCAASAATTKRSPRSTRSGLVTAVGKGDTDVVAFYDNGVAPVPVLLPVSDRSRRPLPDGADADEDRRAGRGQAAQAGHRARRSSAPTPSSSAASAST